MSLEVLLEISCVLCTMLLWDDTDSEPAQGALTCPLPGAFQFP